MYKEYPIKGLRTAKSQLIKIDGVSFDRVNDCQQLKILLQCVAL